MLSSPIIDLAIGLTFVFGVTAALASFVTESIARLIGLRGAYLLSGLRELVDGGTSPTILTDVATDYETTRQLMQAGPKPSPGQPSNAKPSPGQPSDAKPSPGQPSDTKPPSITSALLGGPILGNQGVAGQLSSRSLELGKTKGTGSLPKMKAVRETKEPSDPKPGRLWSQRRSLPSYISARSFADAVMDLVVPNPQGRTTMDAIDNSLRALPAATPFRQSLEALVENADGDVTRFRASVEQWYDDHMDRVSGWYKRRVAIITLVFGAIVVILLNLNALTIGRTLYTENAVSAAVSNVAAKTTSCSSADQGCLANLDSELSAAAASGLPVGWGTVRACAQKGVVCGWWERRGILSPFGGDGSQAAQVLLVLLGFLIMIFALVPGAQFWFGLLTKLNTLRTTGPPPAPAASNPVTLTVVPPPVAPTQAVAAAAAPATAVPEPKAPPEAG